MIDTLVWRELGRRDRRELGLQLTPHRHFGANRRRTEILQTIVGLMQAIAGSDRGMVPGELVEKLVDERGEGLRRRRRWRRRRQGLVRGGPPAAHPPHWGGARE